MVHRASRDNRLTSACSRRPTAAADTERSAAWMFRVTPSEGEIG